VQKQDDQLVATSVDVESTDTIQFSARHEIFIGLVGAIGTRLDDISKTLRDELRTYGYVGTTISLSQTFASFPQYSQLKTPLSRRQYYDLAITSGNEICSVWFEKASAIAQLGIAEASRLRSEDKDKQARVAYIFRSFKRPEEIRQAREVYGSLFYCLAIYADESDRLDRLAKECHARNEEESKIDERVFAQELIKRDRSEGISCGQNVRGAFTEADYFIRSDEDSDVRQAIQRLLKLIFDVPYIGPTRSEIAMMHARTAALRSVDLSRQVGAAIISRDDRLLTTGCNDVPKAGGGQYSAEDIDDRRDFQLGFDTNDSLKREAVEELLERIYAHTKVEALRDAQRAYQSLGEAGCFADTRIDSLIEFGRVVHAENAAINSSCMETISIRDCDLYCTTFPCHMCTRAIINVGIRNVFYIEPYPKSMALALYSDSIVVDKKLSRAEYIDRLASTEVCDRRVHFIAFEGCAPRRYDDLFRYTHSRKDKKTGKAEVFDPTDAKPRMEPAFSTYQKAEAVVVKEVETIIERAKYAFSNAPATPKDN
jgi:deoxycytidylate deaminase